MQRVYIKLTKPYMGCNKIYVELARKNIIRVLLDEVLVALVERMHQRAFCYADNFVVLSGSE